jgi:hypothetical protein
MVSFGGTAGRYTDSQDLADLITVAPVRIP